LKLQEPEMLPPLLDRFTPRAHAGTRLLTAALVWTVVGVILFGKGLWMSRMTSGTHVLIAVLAGVAFGMIKSRLIFDRVAEKIIAHIGSKPCRACLGGLFSARNWMLILVMAVFGRVLGTLTLAAPLKTAIYVTIGSGLVYSSRLMWTAWKTSPLAGTRDLHRS
jgi:uncharacterized membrane protein YiaA